MMLIIFGALKLELSCFFKISKIFSKEKYHNFTIYKEYIYYKKENKSFPVLMVQTGTAKYDTKNTTGYLLQNILKIKALKKNFIKSSTTKSPIISSYRFLRSSK